MSITEFLRRLPRHGNERIFDEDDPRSHARAPFHLNITANEFGEAIKHLIEDGTYRDNSPQRQMCNKCFAGFHQNGDHLTKCKCEHFRNWGWPAKAYNPPEGFIISANEDLNHLGKVKPMTLPM